MSSDTVRLRAYAAKRAGGWRPKITVKLLSLSQSSFTIDYRSKSVLFGPVELSGPAVEFDVQYEAGAPYLVVPMHVDGHALRLLFDTGTNGLVLFEPRIRDRLADLRTRRKETYLNAGGEGSVKEVQLPGIRFGGAGFGKRQAFLWETSADALGDFDGLLGPASLGLKRIAFDFERRTLTWER